MIQLENRWTDLLEIWYGLYTIGVYSEIVLAHWNGKSPQQLRRGFVGWSLTDGANPHERRMGCISPLEAEAPHGLSEEMYVRLCWIRL
jgi:hypothetical protein